MIQIGLFTFSSNKY
ncbi:hypothetical protein VCHC62B1_3397A, partial [Vibrio cholerae HC-62B1]